jgi:hypothetical protein
MEVNRHFEFAEAIRFRRPAIALVLGVPLRTLNNWIDRNDLWQIARSGYYRFGDIFDLAGFSAMRMAHIPERECARYVRNFGFYRGFLHGDQIVDFSHRNGKWDIGLYDPSATVSLRINMRTVGSDIFKGISQLLSVGSNEHTTQEFESFKKLYGRCIELDRLCSESAPLFEEKTK